MSAVSRIEHMLRLAEHVSTGEHEATTALAGARAIATRMVEPERTRWMRRVTDAEKALYLRLNPGAMLEPLVEAAKAMREPMEKLAEATQDLHDFLRQSGFTFHAAGGATYSPPRQTGHGPTFERVWFDEASTFTPPPRTMTFTTAPMDPETIRRMFGINPEG